MSALESVTCGTNSAIQEVNKNRELKFGKNVVKDCKFTSI
jgi:hypothetical protein